MNLKPKDKVIDTTTGSKAEVIATHTYTYPVDLQIASIRLEGNGSKWVPISELKKIN